MGKSGRTDPTWTGAVLHSFPVTHFPTVVLDTVNTSRTLNLSALHNDSDFIVSSNTSDTISTIDASTVRTLNSVSVVTTHSPTPTKNTLTLTTLPVHSYKNTTHSFNEINELSNLAEDAASLNFSMTDKPLSIFNAPTNINLANFPLLSLQPLDSLHQAKQLNALLDPVEPLYPNGGSSADNNPRPVFARDRLSYPRSRDFPVTRYDDILNVR